jgi:hypothetical protein
MPTEKKALTQPLRFAIALLIAGALFKIMHWPGANVMMLVAYAVIPPLYIVRYFKKTEKKLIDHVKLLLVFSWCLASAFRVFHWPYGDIFSIVALIGLVAWIALEMTTIREVSPGVTVQGLSLDGLFTAAVVITITGALFKIMHWPYANIMLIVGLVIGIGWALKSGMLSEK